MKTPEQLKGAIRSMAAKKNLRAQEVLQMFLFERIIERLAVSSFRNNFILKGGLLISSMIGIGERTTMDMDTTVRGIQMEEDEIVAAVKQIISTDVNDGISFEYEKIEPIREERRLFYVGITRAINNLYFYAPKSLRGKFKDPSIFLNNTNLDRKSVV